MQQAIQQLRSETLDMSPIRDDRFYCINGGWYFKARGGIQKGPYHNRETVEAELRLFISRQPMRR